MSEKIIEPVAEATKESPEIEPSNDKTCCKDSNCCGPNTPLIVSVIALLLAGYAAFTAASSANTTAIDNRLNSLDSQISGVNDQLSELDHEMETNRANLIQTKLKKALQSIQEIGNLAGDETRATITEVEQMLQTLTSVGEQLDTPEQAEPADEPTAQSGTPVETTPAEIPANPADQATPTEAPAITAPVTEAAPAEPATVPAADTPAQQTPAVSETDPAAAAGTSEPTTPQAF